MDLEEISEEFHRIIDNMQAHISDDIVAYFGELQPLVDKLDSLIAELKSGKD